MKISCDMRSGLLLSCFILFSLGLNTARAYTPSAEAACNSAGICTSLELIRGEYKAVVRDEMGKTLEMESTSLVRSDKVRFVSAEALPAFPGAYSDSGNGHTETTQAVYHASTGTVVVTTVLYYDAEGNLIDVQVSTMYFNSQQ